MKGLVLKELYTGMAVFRYRSIMLAFYIVLFWGTEQIYTAYYMMVIFTFTTVVNVSRYDETTHWDKYVCAAPVSRRQVVRAKYISPLVMVFGAMVLVMACETIRGSSMSDIIGVLTGIFRGSLLYRSLSLAVIIIFGSTKGVYIILGAVLIPVAAVMIVTRAAPSIDWSFVENVVMFIDNNSSLLPVIIIAAVSAIYLLSYLISRSFYQKKDL